MDNRFLQGAAAASPPTVPDPGDSGYITNGDPVGATPATIIGDYWLHALGEELRAVIEDGGLTPAAGTLTQVRDAIRRLGRFRNVQQVTATDAGWTAPETGWYLIELWGAGGGGAGAAGASGAAGGWAAKLMHLDAGEAVALTIGAGGAAATHPSAAGNGGSTMFGAHFSATGGAGGAAGAGNGGTGSGGDINQAGGDGTDLSAVGNGAPGGDAPGAGGSGGSGAGGAGKAPGGGGGAAYQYDGSTNPSGAGARGEIRIWY